MHIQTNYHIITGGPGSGKSTLIDALRNKGYTCVPESGRAIIRQEVESGGTALPWADKNAFARLMFQQAVADFQSHRALEGPVFFDRGLPDVTGYLRLCKLPMPEDIEAANAQWRYHPVVLIAPPWEEIFSNDSERKQDFAEAIATFEQMEAVYASLGYKLLHLPKASVEKRVDFVLRTCCKDGSG